MFDLFENAQEIAQEEYEEQFLNHARIQAKKKEKMLYEMKAVSDTEFVYLRALKEVFKNDLTVDDLKKRLDEQSKFEKLGREYERFKKKYEVKYGSELIEKIKEKEKEIKKLEHQLTYIYNLFEEVDINKPADLIKKVRQLEHENSKLKKELENQPNKVETIIENDPTIEAKANAFQKVIAQLGTEDVFDRIEKLKKKANLPTQLTKEDENFLFDGQNILSNLVLSLIEQEDYKVKNVLEYAIRYLLTWDEFFPEQLKELEEIEEFDDYY